MSQTPDNRTPANARNAQKSTGPKTAQGKARSSKNALKHGLTSTDVVLPNEDPAAFQARLDEWNDYYRPHDPAQAAVIDRAVAAKWKLDRCTRLETARLSLKVRHAVDQYDVDQFARAEAIGRELIFEPICRTEPPQTHDPLFQARMARRAAANPAILVKQLQMTAQGVDWLLERWVELAKMLEHHGFWHYVEKFTAIWMLGRRPEDVLEDKVVQRIFLACNIAHPDTDDNDPDRFDLWDECYQAKMGLEGRPMYFFHVDAIRPLRPADHLTARAILWDVFTKEVTRLRELKANYLDPLNAADRAAAEERAMFDDSKEGVLLRRYETACERELHRSIADLVKLRKEAPPACGSDDDEAEIRNEPITEPSSDQEVTSDAPAASPVAPSSRVSAKPVDALVTPGAALAGLEKPPAAAV